MTAAAWDFTEACAARRKASEDQEATENARLEASKALAAAEKAYRIALARKIIDCHQDDGIAWTVAPDIARGDPTVAQLRYERDVAAGVADALEQSSWRHAADRRDLGRLIAWSERQGIADGSETGIRRAA